MLEICMLLYKVLHFVYVYIPSSVDIATVYGLDGRYSFPGMGEEFIFPHNVQTGSGAYPRSCPVGTGLYFTGGKAAGA
jgi:hypothetical protein